jgi:glycosyltransferase involved in cell wall biosynthesis
MPQTANPIPAGLSIVIPCYNEVESIPQLVQQLREVPWPVYIVDDGSTDGSWDLLSKLSGKIVCSRLKHHRGKTAALREGVLKANTPLIATLDADLQHYPEQISELLKHWNQSCDVLLASRTRRSDSWAKRVWSRLGNLLSNWLFGISLKDQNTPLKVFRREVALRVGWFDNAHRFFCAMALQLGFSVKEISLPHFARKNGSSKYGYLDRLVANGIAYRQFLNWQWEQNAQTEKKI